MATTWQVTVQENEAGELFIELPNELIEVLGWQVGDMLKWTEAPEQAGAYLLRRA